MTRGDGSSATAVRAAYPFTGTGPGALVHWACLLECGHTIELDLEPGTRPRRSSCPRCRAREGSGSTAAVPAAARSVEPPREERAPAKSPVVVSPQAASGRRVSRREAGAGRSGRAAGAASALPAADPRQLGFWFDLDE